RDQYRGYHETDGVVHEERREYAAPHDDTNEQPSGGGHPREQPFRGDLEEASFLQVAHENHDAEKEYQDIEIDRGVGLVERQPAQHHHRDRAQKARRRPVEMEKTDRLHGDEEVSDGEDEERRGRGHGCEVQQRHHTVLGSRSRRNCASRLRPSRATLAGIDSASASVVRKFTMQARRTNRPSRTALVTKSSPPVLSLRSRASLRLLRYPSTSGVPGVRSSGTNRKVAMLSPRVNASISGWASA